MLVQLLLIAGILQMVYAIFLCNKIITLVDKANVKAWLTLFWLLCFFLLGYIGYLVRSMMASEESFISALITGSVFCFGATFVLIVFSVNHRSIGILSGDAKRVNSTNRSIQTDFQEANKQLKTLERMNIAVEKKNARLESMLEDFYTLRLSMDKSGDPQIKRENRAMREKIDRIVKNPRKF